MKPGDIIAPSGQTGIGAPHLHFELRNPAQEPLIPRDVGYSWSDTALPEIRQILVAPRDAESTVSGDLLPQTFSVTHQGNGQYTCPPIQATGRIGLALDTMDPGSGGYRLGVHTMRVLDGDQELFRINHDKLSYDNHRNGTVAYHPYFRDEGRFLTLWRWSDNVCDIYASSLGDGWINIPQDGTKLTVEVADFFGRKSTLHIPIHSGKPTHTPNAHTPTSQGRAELTCVGEFLIATLRFTDTESVLPTLTLNGKAAATSPGFIQVDNKTFRAAITPTRTGPLSITMQHPRMTQQEETVGVWVRGQGSSWTQGDVKVNVPGVAPYGTTFLQAKPMTNLSATGGLRALGTGYKLWPEAMPLNAALEVSIPYPTNATNTRQVHVYKKTRGGWSREDSRKEGDRLVFKTTKLGTFMAMEDSTPPSIQKVSPQQGYATQTRRPRIQATIADNASGIVSIDVRCGKKWLLTAYDPERRHIAWERDEDLPPGPQTITMRVIDKAGNIATTTRNITVAQ